MLTILEHNLNYLQKMDEIENIVTEFIIEKEPKMGSILNLNYDSEKDITEVSLVEEKKTKKKKE
jgi:hypothetical protein